jgi:imidazolonepropionase-like amidohydrolase
MRTALAVSILVAATGCGSRPPPRASAEVPRSALTPSAPPSDTTLRYDIVFADRVAGHDVLVRHGDGSYDEDFEFNDRGRGPKLHARTEVGPDGLPSRLEGAGKDYLHRDVRERATCDAARCRWETDRDHGEGPRAFYAALYQGVPNEVLLRAARGAKDGALRLLPGGTLRATKVAEATVTKAGETRHVIAWQIAGFGLTPTISWFDDDGAWFGDMGDGFSCIREGWASVAPELLALERPLGAARREEIMRNVAHRSDKGLAIVHARLFDPAKKKTIDDATILIDNQRIKAVGPKIAPPAQYEVLDAEGKTALPGLWDMHVHLDDDQGMLQIAEGITTVRDLGNDIETSIARRGRWESGKELGPRVLLAGIIDGRGPLQVTRGAFADTPEEVRAAVDRYAASGYVQIKIYSSLKPELVPVVLEAAHAKGMRVSGHVPAHMIAEDAIKAGYDELQHINFLILDLVADRDTDTRTPLRLTIPAEKAVDVELDAPKTKALVDLLVLKHTVVDPTLSAFEDDFTIRADHPSPALAPVLARLPPQVRRGATSGGLPVPEGMDARFHGSFKRCQELVKRLYDRHVPIVAGTDSFAGFSLHRELELYSEAGIPNADVLALATLGAAKVMKRDKTSGSIEPGKDADLVLVDGDPLVKMRDVRNVVNVVKAGVLVDTRKTEAALSIAPP